MAKNVSYKKSITTKLKVVGYYDNETLSIETEEGSKSLKTLLRDFTGAPVEIVVTVKQEDELEIPTL